MSRIVRHPVAMLTGATGFVGSHLARRLVAEGWEVHALVRPSSSLVPLTSVLDRMTLHTCEPGEDPSAALARARPEIVFHLASLFLAAHEAGDIRPLVESNITFPLQLVQAMVDNGVYRLVNTGTSWQHYEDRAYSPVCLYAASKQAFETLLEYFIESTPLRVITLELFDIYGPDDSRGKLFSLLKKARRRKTPLAMSPGEQFIDPVFIDDVVEAYLTAAGRFKDGEIPGHEHYGISSGNPIRLKDLVGLFERLSGSEIPVRWGARPYRPREVMTPWSKGASLPGWRPKVSLEQGIRQIL
ncbi:MAG: NAD(P)-dependent oxidoreductase [Deltaproteobacteria bacterium]|nr:NAD(P)-dependent oxidoreductase [Deltaproteobacteria bacterium]